MQPIISTPSNWETVYKSYNGIADSELENKAYNDRGEIRIETYVTGNYDKWNKASNRKEGETYQAPCRESVILSMRNEARQR